MNTYVFIGWDWNVGPDGPPLESIPVGAWAEKDGSRWYMVYPP